MDAREAYLKRREAEINVMEDELDRLEEQYDGSNRPEAERLEEDVRRTQNLIDNFKNEIKVQKEQGGGEWSVERERLQKKWNVINESLTSTLLNLGR